jgi:hypothetical protein
VLPVAAFAAPEIFGLVTSTSAYVSVKKWGAGAPHSDFAKT